jgi:hypothetical protein
MEGVFDVTGLIRYGSKTVHLELQISGTPLQQKKTVRYDISLQHLQTAEFKRRAVGSRIVIEAKSLDAIEEIPGVEWNRLTLTVGRKYRDQAADLATHLQIDLTEMRLEEM